MFLVLLALLALVYGVFYYFTSTFDFWKKKGVKGPKPIPFFGNCYESTIRRKFVGKVVKEIHCDYPDEKVVGIYTMLTPVLIIRDLDYIKHILIKDFDFFSERGIEFSKKGLGANLFHADGETWRVLRNRFTPLFTSGKLKNMSYLMTNGAEQFLNYVDTLVTIQPEQNIHKLVQKYTMSTISSCAFGIDTKMSNDGLLERVASFDNLIFGVNYFAELDMMYPGLLLKLNASLFPREISNFFYELSKNVITQRKGAPIGRKDFMDLILELRQQREIKTVRRSDEKELHLEFNEDVIAAQTFVFYVAGYETSATTMTFLLYELARNKDVQEKLLEEVDEVLKKFGGKVSYDCVNELKYMDKVFDETLRIYPVVSMLQRRAETNYKFPGSDLEIKKGQICYISPWGIHHDPKIYPNPEKFDPERFSPENIGKRHPCAYLPFGLGPRNCIGMRFAKVQSRICLVSLLSKYRVETTERTWKSTMYDPYRVVTTPTGGMYLKLVPRN
ncbi:cytochrome P450 6B1-like [Amyelois transitella]|uniref:cytochrome P450 6B1-like n=1 Tax=Amyelois transitella TaxID=680683 RepID=UPI00298F742E|nr:cytochrome P450 6B1-like [Amyelois transitella]